MELRLARKTQHRARAPTRRRCFAEQPDSNEPGAVYCLELLLHALAVFRAGAAGRRKQVAIHTLEVTIDLLCLNDCLGSIERGQVAFRSQACTLSAVHLFDLPVAIIER